MTFGEDAPTAHRQPPPGDGQPAQPLAVGALRLAGHPNLAAALRHTGRDPARPLMILGWTHLTLS